MAKSLVSVCMITYNQEAYIEEAITGVLKQQTDFEVEFIISNDASTDRTDQIIRKIIKDNPNNLQIRYYSHSENRGMMQNFIFSLDKAKGEYIALCEGDDYWTNPLKLQKQVSFMAKNPDCSFCFHKAYIKKQSNIDLALNEYPLGVKKKVLTASEYLRIPSSATSSLMYRNRPVKSLKKLDHSHADFILYCELLERGNAGFIDLNMSVYRKHEQGVSYNYGSEPYLYKRIKELKEAARTFTSPKVCEEINRMHQQHILRYLKLYKNKIPILRLLDICFDLTCNNFFQNRVKKKIKKEILIYAIRV